MYHQRIKLMNKDY